MIPLHRQILENDGAMEFSTRAEQTVCLLAVGDLAFHSLALEAMEPTMKECLMG